MPTGHQQVAAASPRYRSRISNRSCMHLDVDGRSAPARRFRDLCRAYEAELGGNITEIERDLIRQAAALTQRQETLQACIARGEAVDDSELIRLSGASRRILATLRKRSTKAAPATPSPSSASYRALIAERA